MLFCSNIYSFITHNNSHKYPSDFHTDVITYKLHVSVHKSLFSQQNIYHYSKLSLLKIPIFHTGIFKLNFNVTAAIRLHNTKLSYLQLTHYTECQSLSRMFSSKWLPSAIYSNVKKRIHHENDNHDKRHVLNDTSTRKHP